MDRAHNHSSMLVLFIILMAVGRPASVVASSDERLPFPHPIEITLSVADDEIVTFQPVIARVTLVNQGAHPFELDVRADGAPYALTCMTAYRGGKYFRHDQRIRRSGPEKHSITLGPGERTTGEILIWVGSPTGFAFADPGNYTVQFAFRPDDRYAAVLTNMVELSVVPDVAHNREFSIELSEIAYEYFGYDPAIVRRNEGEEILIGYRLIREILKVQKPFGIDAQGDAYNRKRAKLVETLAEMLDRFPDSSYSGYIARYLGLVHLHTVIDEFSLGRHEVRRNAEHPSMWDGTACRADASYKKSLQYLTKADKSNLWPRATAIENLAILHIVAQEWDEAEACLMELRTKYAESDGVQRADELERQMAEYKAESGRRKAPAP